MFTKLDNDKAKKAIEMLKKEYPSAKYYLNFSTPIDLVGAAIISAQTRDEVVNSIAPALFKRFKTARDYADTSVDELVSFIGKVSFAGNKAQNIIKTFKIIKEKYNGKVPRKMEELLELPGIGRKTANTILINAFGIAEGIPVDTWVIKLSYRIGFSESKKPDDIEQDLAKMFDKKDWGKITYILKTHGKKICQSQIPLCSRCLLNKICPKNGVVKSK